MGAKRVLRYDFQSNSTSKAEWTPEGFLRVQARATRTGVLVYKTSDGETVRELRLPEEVFAPESMNTLAMKPVTNDHPDTLLNPETAASHTVGFTGEQVKQAQGKYLDIPVVVTDKRALEDAKDGKVQVSPGYSCELEEKSGKFEGEHYDAIQRNIRYNHLAIVKRGRSGPEVCLRLDSDGAVAVGLSNVKARNPSGFDKTKERQKMAKIKLNGNMHEVEDDVAEDFKSHMKAYKESVAKSKMDDEESDEEMEKARDDAKKAKADAKRAKNEKEESEERADAAEARADAAEAELKKLKAERKDSAPTGAKLSQLVKERTSLERVGQLVGLEKMDAMEDGDLKKAIIKADDSDAVLDGKSDDYVNARFDHAVVSIKRADERARAAGKSLVEDRQDGGDVPDSDKARASMITKMGSAWEGKGK
jgi:uncharacterized protein